MDIESLGYRSSEPRSTVADVHHALTRDFQNYFPTYLDTNFAAVVI